MKVDINKIQDYVIKKLITVQKHSIYNYSIYNYSQKVQFDKLWDDITIMCRGLILDDEGNIIAKPFDKFFNYEEIQNTVKVDFNNSKIFEKADGSLGIAYLTPDLELAFATRGSFSSEQAIEALKIFNETFTDKEKDHLEEMLANGYTELFEIIYPENRIVVDYENKRMLKYLGSILIEKNEFNFFPFYSENVKIINNINNFENLKQSINPKEEGYVIRTADNVVCKIKGNEYLRLHRLMTEINSKNIWEALKDEVSLNEFLENVPDEFYNWVKNIKGELENKFQNLYIKINQIFTNEILAYSSDRKELALKIIKDYNEYKDILFALLDKKSIKPLIWKRLKPEVAEKPFAFKEDI